MSLKISIGELNSRLSWLRHRENFFYLAVNLIKYLINLCEKTGTEYSRLLPKRCLENRRMRVFH